MVALLNRYKRLHNLTVFEPQDPELMSRQEQYRALQAIHIIKERQYGKIKGRTCSEGSPQQNYTPCEEATSLIIELEALFSSLIIDDHEGRSLHTFDVPGAYLHASIPDDNIFHMKSEGEFVDIMCEVNP